MTSTCWVVVYEGTTADTGVLRDLLEAAGLTARIGDEVMGAMAPYVIAGGSLSAVKVLVPEDQVERAAPVAAEFAARMQLGEGSGSPVFEPWECPCCHEQNDGSFDICWNCQTEKA